MSRLLSSLHRSAGAPPPSGSPSSAHVPPADEPPPGAPLMNALRWVLFGVLALVAVVALAAYFRGRTPAARETAATAAGVYYCPMHPNVTSDRPGECPICGMSLEKREPGGASSSARGNVPQLTTIHLTPERIQMIGVRTLVAAPGGLAPERELTGFVAPDEERIERLQVRVSGWVQEMNVGAVGDFVARGAPVLTLNSPELFQSESEFLIALAAADSGTHEHDRRLLDAARSRLRIQGVADEEIRRLERTRQASARLTLYSPAAGTVMERGVVSGQYVGPGTPLLTIADLSRVWVLIDVYERDLAMVRPGSHARFESEALPGRTMEGTIDFVYPTVDPNTRTAKARLVLANPNHALRPGTFGTVRVRGAAPRAGLVLPGEAVINTGNERYVFLAHANGHFEPRRVRVGREEGDAVEILSGLAAGDTVVASGSFLIDSESRLEAALGGMDNAGVSPAKTPAADPHRGPR